MLRATALAALAIAFLTASAAATVNDEKVNGDLLSDRAGPSVLNRLPGYKCTFGGTGPT